MAAFSVGDEVFVDGKGMGVVTEVPVLDEVYLRDHEQYYSVKIMDAWEPCVKPEDKKLGAFKHKETKEFRDHQFDVHGCVPESEITS